MNALFLYVSLIFLTFAVHELFKDHTAYNLEIAVLAQFRAWIDRALSLVFHFSFQKEMVSDRISLKEVLGSLDNAYTRIVPENNKEGPGR